MELQKEFHTQTQESKARPKVAIIVLNWNGWRDTIECLESIGKITYPNYEVILVDNGSVDNSVTRISEWIMSGSEYWGGVRETSGEIAPAFLSGVTFVLRRERLILVHSKENLGFAGGCNLAIRIGLNDPSIEYFYLLNNDAHLTPQSLDELISIATSAKADIAGSVIWEHPSSGPIFAGSASLAELIWPTPIRLFFRLHAKKGLVLHVSMVPGSAMLLTRRLVELRLASKGYLFNPLLFLYGEELDLCLWAKNSGFRSIIALRSIVYHHRGPDELQKTTRAQYYLARNLMLVGAIHLPLLLKYPFFAWHFLFRLLLALRWLLRRKYGIAKCIIQGLRDAIMELALQELL
ncbi:MAG: glycosyltransferase family 2 protein [Candidatus Methanomethyliaceae archaeon]